MPGIFASGGLGMASLFAVTDQVELALVTGFFTLATTTVTAVFAYLNRRDLRKVRTEANRDRKQMSDDINAPRHIGSSAGDHSPVLLPPQHRRTHRAGDDEKDRK